MHAGIFGTFPEWKWWNYLLVDAWTYRTRPSRVLFANGYQVLCHTRAWSVLARICREEAALLDTLRETYAVPRYAHESDTLDALQWLLGSTFTPHEATLNPFARLIVFERERPQVPPQPELPRLRPAPPALSAKSSWVRIACVDDGQPPRPATGVALEVVTASAEVRGAYTDQDGAAYLDGIAPGRVSIRVLGRDGRTWRPLEGDTATPCSSDGRFTWHEVRRGEHLSGLARRYGLQDWREIWDFRANEALRKRRKSPHVLHPGDLLAVPVVRLAEISRESEQTHRIEVDGWRVRRGYALDARDLRFHARSSVLLAQYTPATEREVRSDAPGLDALVSALRHAEENPARPLLLVGHSDAVEAPEEDRALSEARATAVRHMLRGARDAWVALVQQHSCPEDLDAILRWCAEARGWSCAPGEQADADATRALRAFQEAFNRSHDARIAEDGALGPETWGAIFDVYQQQLAQRLETDALGLEALQSALHFCAAAESYGCGSSLAVHAERDGEASAYRRADVLFFEPGDEPAAHDLEQGPLAEPDFAFTPFAPREAPRDHVRLAVRELVYPGAESDSVPLESKWLYVIAHGALAFSVQAVSTSEWRITRAVPPGTESVRDGRIPLQSARSYRLLLSPVPLSEAALQRLLTNLDRCVWLTSVDRPGALRGQDATLLVRDVFQWALDLHHRAYLPNLEVWQSWLQDEDRASRHFIVSALKCIVDQGDAPGIQRHLRSGEPNQFLARHREEEQAARGAAEQAASGVASFVDCEDHRIIEEAHVGAGTAGVELAVVHWASVLGELAQTFAGRQLLDVVARDAERVPRRFVFADPPPLALEFGAKRYLGLAGRALLKELGPALVAHVYPKQTRLEAVARYLERLGEAKPLIGTYRQVQTNLKRGRKLTHKVESRKSIQKLIRAASSAAEAAHEARLPKGLVASQRLSEAYERNLHALDAAALLVLEVVNLGLALQGALDERSDTPTLETVASVLGSSADLGIAVLDAQQILLSATTRTAKSVLGMISGACDAFAFAQAARGADSRYDYNQAIGYGLAAGGGVGVFVGSSLVFANSVWGGGVAAGGAASAGGAAAAGGWQLTFGTLVGAIGAIAIGAGVAIAAIAEDNAYQQFAKLCFLGDEHGAKRGEAFYSWSPAALPAGRIQDEAAALITLLSSFDIEFTGTSLALHPRFYRAGDAFEIYVEVQPINYAKNACVIEVDLGTEQVTQLRGLRPLREGSKIFKDAPGRITRIEIDLRDAEPPSSPAVIQYYGGLVRARLRFAHGKETWFVPPTPPAGGREQPWVQLSATFGDLGTTLASTRRGTSSDASLRVDGVKQSIESGMKELHD